MDVRNLASSAEDFTGNVWLLESGERRALVDAGEGDCWQEIRDLESVEKVVITHSHHDHVGNLPDIVEEFSPEVLAFEPCNLSVDAEEIGDSQKVELAGKSFRVIHSPGHRDDSVCLYSSEEKILFAGDLVFPDGGFGRTDLEQGDRDLLISSIEDVAELNVDRMYSGHGEAVVSEADQQIQRSLENARKRQSKY
ncbi:MAG: MBL fold metallo-hydrolase [Candidatus Nanohaloarchaea archaeon]